MLLRNPWLAPLMRPPPEADAAQSVDASQASEAPATHETPSFLTEDKEVAEWVKKQLERRKAGHLQDATKPALHAVALDKVATSPIHDGEPAALPQAH
jgi:mitogen-activated protein kinase kinase